MINNVALMFFPTYEEKPYKLEGENRTVMMFSR